jgi:hypothetical protein
MWSQTQDRQVYDRAWATSGPRSWEEDARQEYIPSTPADTRAADRDRPGARPRPFSSVARPMAKEVQPAKEKGAPWWERLHSERTGNANRGSTSSSERMGSNAPPLVRARAHADFKTRDQRLKDRESSTTLTGGSEIQIGFGLDAPRTEYRPRANYYPYQSPSGAGSVAAPATGAVRERPRSATSTSRPRHNYCFDTPGWKPAWGN